MIYFYIGLAGLIGTLARFLCSRTLQVAQSVMPWATLTVNLLGCFAIGFLYHLSVTQQWPVTLKWVIFSGFLAAFTTFSAFGLETIHLLQKNEFLWAFSYVLISNLGGFLLVYCGLKVAQVVV